MNDFFYFPKSHKTGTLQTMNKITNKILYSLEIYKSIRRKNKLFLSIFGGGKAILTLKNIFYAKKANNQIKEAIKNDLTTYKIYKAKIREKEDRQIEKEKER